MNKELLKIFNNDQKDRRDPVVRANPALLSKNDRVRKKMVQEYIDANKLITAKDYYLAAMIFHHGPSIQDSVKAVKLSKTSYELGHKKSLLLCATCLDRLLMKKGKKQKFGTQYRKNNAKSKWKLLPVDSRTTDEERKKWGIAPLSKLIANVNKLNK